MKRLLVIGMSFICLNGSNEPRRKYTMHELHVIKQKMDFEKYQEIMNRRHLNTKKKKLVKYKPVVVPNNSPETKAIKPKLPVPEIVIVFEEFKG